LKKDTPLLNMNIRFPIFLLSSLLVYKIATAPEQVLGAATENFSDLAIGQLSTPQVSTITSFEEKEETAGEPIPYDTIYKDDAEMEVGEKRTEKEGKDGELRNTYKITYWYGQESKRELLSIEKELPQDEVTRVGTKIVWRSVKASREKNVEGREISYWRKFTNVWATSYDKSCYGCDEYTAVGAKLDYGVCAVDPKVIKLYTTIYVPGYGICKALDVGGAIKGNKIDVGFYDLHAQSAEVGWRGSHFTDIYLMDNEEANITLLK